MDAISIPFSMDAKNVCGGSWSPDGKYYFFSSWDGESCSLWAVSEAQHWWRKNAMAPQQLTFGPYVDWSPGDQQ